MQQLIKKTGFKKAIEAEAPSGVAAFILASVFFKFGSFAWECLAFLATWYVLSFVHEMLMDAMRDRSAE